MKRRISPPASASESRPVDQLTPHPQQNHVFTPPSPADVEQLAKDIEANGLRNPIEILPDGTIIRGHSRLLAVKRLGWETVAVIVRHDLAKLGEAAVLTALVDDNLHRRNLSPLEIAKSAVVLINSGKLDGGNLFEALGEHKETIAKQHNITVRTLNRYIAITRTPLEIQHAVSRDLLSMEQAGKLAQLGDQDQKRAAKAIGDLFAKEERLGSKLKGKIKAAVKEVLGPSVKGRRAYSPIALLVNALEAAQESLLGDEVTLTQYWLDRRDVFQSGRDLLDGILDLIDEQAEFERDLQQAA